MVLLLLTQKYCLVKDTKGDMTTVNNEVAAIQELMHRFAAAFNSGNIDAIMKNYVQNETFVLFDLVPRKEYLGADAYHKAWTEMFAHFKGQPKISIHELVITVDNNVAFGHSFQHVIGADMQDQLIDRWVRVTDGYRNINGTWFIAHEHISMPVDLRTGKLVAFTGL
jgi:ketosteroid isomerase-like protein